MSGKTMQCCKWPPLTCTSLHYINDLHCIKLPSIQFCGQFIMPPVQLYCLLPFVSALWLPFWLHAEISAWSGNCHAICIGALAVLLPRNLWCGLAHRTVPPVLRSYTSRWLQRISLGGCGLHSVLLYVDTFQFCPCEPDVRCQMRMVWLSLWKCRMWM